LKDINSLQIDSRPIASHPASRPSPALLSMAGSIAVVIVSYNTREHLRACLATVLADTPCQVIVVDNASSDGSPEMIASSYPQVVLHSNKHNPGYGAAANQAIANCETNYVVLLNSDTRLQPGGLRALSVYLDRNPRAAIVGPRLVNLDGTLQRSCFPFPTPLNAFLHESALSDMVRRIPVLREHYLHTWSHMRPRVVPWVLGAALAIRREAFEAVGGFDESFFMYSEEVDLCYRLRAADWQVHFAPITSVVHVGGASTDRHRADMAVQLYASMSQFYRHHYSRWQMQQLRLVKTYIMLRNIVRDTARLYQVRGPCERSRLVEDLKIWKRVLLEAWYR
jgi:N-acetylglucosaminyl-diphospho-decaprenol L-rhamnosyltransferase